MRNIFITAVKIIGLYQFCNAFNKFSALTLFWDSDLWQNMSAKILAEHVCSPLLMFALAYALVFKTQWLADKAGLVENAEAPDIKRDDLLAAGIKLLGVYMGMLVASYAMMILGGLLAGMVGGSWGFSFGLFSVFSFVVTLLLAVIFLFKTAAVMGMIAKTDGAPWRKVALATLAVLVVVLAITAGGNLFLRNKYFSDLRTTQNFSVNWDDYGDLDVHDDEIISSEFNESEFHVPVVEEKVF